MPVRHEGDFQRKHIRTWDAWVEDTIREAGERGEFDDLPDRGKRIHLEDTPFAPEMASALRTLRNAGYQPTWMELDKEITRDRRELEEFLARSVAWIREQAGSARPGQTEPASSARQGLFARLWEWFLHGEGAPARSGPARLTPVDVSRLRDSLRTQYLERAAAIDRKITAFHAALPRNLWHLERMRLTPEAAARAFDAACPPFPGERRSGHGTGGQE